ncbi:hypothetical protein QFZ63_001548 [Streptomyces sp. B3I7]|uniref:DUF6221 family protein n=1 Tax=Streptomyces sp. B3I7 TaxID=3042269 RepID=UPI002788211E|nr:DUF6221 family protein [Streptomyces sp. B3I7]MDQ0809834.1 hypothetical protein [Streptomyces sp. B3I7]
MSEIADFLRARYAERRALAEAATPGPWHAEPCVYGPPEEGWGHPAYWEIKAGSVEVVAHQIHEGGGIDQEANARHIAANDPAFVIADCDAKLALIDEIDYDPPAAEDLTDQELHARCAHPAWEYRTTTGPRKQWDGVDDPPCDDDGNPEPGWERNLDAGCPGEGWERFDYIEESYWRRPRPEGPRPLHIPRTLRLLAQPFAGHPQHKGEEWAP